MTRVTNDDIMRAIGNLEGTTKAIHETMEKTHKRLNAYDTRLRGVEGKQYWFMGIAAGAGAVLSALGKKMGLM